MSLYDDVTFGFMSEVVGEFAVVMSFLWNERAGRAMHEEDRRFSEWVDLGGEG